MKKISVYDMQKNFYIDEVTCFEHPIAVAMNYYSSKCSSLYLTLAKMYGIYFGDGRENIRETIFKSIREIIGINRVEYGKATVDIIRKNIDKGIPVIVGVNLKNIFYSEYYMKRDWGHWILVNGYDEQNKTFNIVDNTQFGKLGERYDEFVITYDILLQASKEYRKRFGNEYVCLALEQEKEFDYKRALIHILEKYDAIEIDNISEYRQIQLLEMLNEVSADNSEHGKYYREEFKKKLININKYREVLFEEIASIMADFNYDIEKRYIYQGRIKNLYELWDNYIMVNLVKASRGRFIACNSNEISAAENDIQNEIKAFIEYLYKNENISDNENKNKIKDEITYEKINNGDGIIYGNDEKIIFNFDGKRTYNWWIEDEAPKVKIYSGHIENNSNIKINTCIEIVRDTVSQYDGMLQTGIYIHTYADNRNYICGFEGNEKWILDRVGYDGLYLDINNKYEISVEITQSVVIFRKVVKQDEYQIFSQKVNTDDGLEVGLVCKTWNKPSKVKVLFKNTEIRK